MRKQSAILRCSAVIALALGVFCLLLAGPGSAAAGTAKYPAKGIDVIVPFAPGAGTDLMGRVVAEALSKKWGVPVNVVNKPGGNTIIGVNEVMRAAHDGYTLLVDSPGSSSMQVGMKDLPYKVEERTFVARAAASPMAFIVPANSPWKDLKAVAEAEKKDPGALTWTSLGGASGVDLVMQQFFKAAGIDVPKTRMVTYPGAAMPRSVKGLIYGLRVHAGVPPEQLEWHGHNDFYKVLINASTAWLYGCCGANGTLLGIGERTGNTPLEGLVFEYAGLRGTLDGMDTTAITEIARYFADEIGYEIPLTRQFYRYVPPRPLEEIEADIRIIEKDIMEMLRDITN
jgi:hypothetical protein